MTTLKKIAVINDLSGLGKCSLTAALPVISVMGVQACPLPTAVLSNQTGFSSYYCVDFTDHMEAYIEEWEKRNFSPDGIYCGYLADGRQAELAESFITRFSKNAPLILVDPVMGDQGCTYDMYSDTFLEKMRSLVKRADVITPNLTEALLLLYGKEEMQKRWACLSKAADKEIQIELEEIGRLLTERFGLRAAAVTGIDLQTTDGVAMGNLVCQQGEIFWVTAKKEGGSYSGTGDLFASVLAAGLVQGMELLTCVQKAVDFLGGAIRDAVKEGRDRNEGVCFEKYLKLLL